MIKLVVFDHDMTLVDSSYAIMEGFNYVARHEGLPEVSHELTMKHIAEPLPQFSRSLLGGFSQEWAVLYRSQSERLEREFIRMYPDTVSALSKLRDLGLKLAVVSNRERPSLVIEREGLSQWFDAVAGAEEPFGNMPYKPAPDMLNALMKYLGVGADETVYVGDADVDIETARNAHVCGIGITAGMFTREDFMRIGAWKVVDTLSEIAGIIADE